MGLGGVSMLLPRSMLPSSAATRVNVSWNSRPLSTVLTICPGVGDLAHPNPSILRLRTVVLQSWCAQPASSYSACRQSTSLRCDAMRFPLSWYLLEPLWLQPPFNALGGVIFFPSHLFFSFERASFCIFIALLGLVEQAFLLLSTVFCTWV